MTGRWVESPYGRAGGSYEGLTAFERIIIDHFDRIVPDGVYQATDGILCDLYMRGYSPAFFGRRMHKMAKKGLIRRGPGMRSIWPSYNGRATYGPVPGRKPRRTIGDEAAERYMARNSS